MTADEIKKAIKNLIYSNNILSERIENMEIAEKFNDGIYLNLDYCKEEYKSVKLAIQVLQAELERIENKPLTIEQLKNMVGEPEWYCYKHMTSIPFIIKDLIFSNLLNANVLIVSENQKIVLGENTFFYKCKPQEK